MKDQENKKMFLLQHMIKLHDLTYNYSDDPAAYKLGQMQDTIIKDFVAGLNGDDKRQARILWNKNVDNNIASHLASEFYWGA